MTINSETIMQIKSGNNEVKNITFAELKQVIDEISEKYDYAFKSSEITKIAIKIFEDTIITYDLSDLDFVVFFSNKLIAKIEIELANKLNNDPTCEIISAVVNKDEEKELLSDIYDQINMVCLILSKTSESVLDDAIDYLLLNNERVREYVRVISKQDNSNNDNKIINKLLEKYRNFISNQDLDKYDDIYRIYMNDIIQYRLLSHEETMELFDKYLSGDNQAKETLINSNLRLAAFVARHYFGRGLDIMDVIQEGNLGLIRAVEKFDPNKDVRFSTYAYIWIKQKIIRGIAMQSKNIDVPIHVYDEYYKNMKKLKSREYQLGRTLTYEERKTFFGISDERMQVYENLIESNTTSLNLKVGEFEDSEFGDFLVDENSPEQEQNILSAMVDKSIGTFIVNSSLNANEKKVILLRFGYVNDKLYTLEEIGQMFGVSRERIRQIEKNTLIKLKSMPEFLELINVEDYHDNKHLTVNVPKRRKFNQKKLDIKNAEKFPHCSEEEFNQIKKYLDQTYINLLAYLSVRDQTVLSLKLGTLNGIYYNNYSIAKLLSTEEEKVDLHVRNALWVLETLYIDKYGSAYQLEI